MRLTDYHGATALRAAAKFLWLTRGVSRVESAPLWRRRRAEKKVRGERA
jgi:hypothetical protein